MDKPRISVIMGIYNCASTLVEALDSLYAQTYRDFKIILCEDGSSDNTYQVAKDYASLHNNIILIKNDKNMGLNYTLNRCLEYADTEYVARMDGDDISLPERLEKEISFLDTHPEYAVVSGPMIYFDENGDFNRGVGHGEVTKLDFIKTSVICHAPCMVRTEIFKAVGGYTVDKHLLRIEDYHLWYKIFSAGYKLYMLKDPIYKMRDDRNAYRRRTFKSRVNACRLRLKVYRNLNIPFYYYPTAFKGLIVGMLPKSIYKKLHQQRFK